MKTQNSNNEEEKMIPNIYRDPTVILIIGNALMLRPSFLECRRNQLTPPSRENKKKETARRYKEVIHNGRGGRGGRGEDDQVARVPKSMTSILQF